MPEPDEADPRFLRYPGKVGDRDADQSVDRVNAVEFQGVDEHAETVGQLGGYRLVAHGLYCCPISHRRPRPGCYAPIDNVYRVVADEYWTTARHPGMVQVDPGFGSS